MPLFIKYDHDKLATTPCIIGGRRVVYKLLIFGTSQKFRPKF